MRPAPPTPPTSPALEARIARVVARFVAAGYRAEDCRGGRSERILHEWLGMDLRPAALDECIAELRARDQARPHWPGLLARWPVVALEARVPACLEAHRARADLLGDARARPPADPIAEHARRVRHEIDVMRQLGEERP